MFHRLFISRSRVRAAFTILLLSSIPATAPAAAYKPTDWWPDPSTGLMWSGGAVRGLKWTQASAYCSALTLGGYSVWRIPTDAEMKAITGSETVDPEPSARSAAGGTAHIPPEPYSITVYSGGLDDGNRFLWTADEKNGQYGAIEGGHELAYIKSTSSRNSFCVRTMEPDLLAIAKEANVGVRVPDLQTLKAYAQLGVTARTSFNAGQYADAISQAKAVLSTYPNFAPAYWAIGISYGMLNQWDLATSNIEASLKIDKNFQDAKDAKDWAKAGEKEFKKSGKTPAPPKWN